MKLKKKAGVGVKNYKKKKHIKTAFLRCTEIR